MESSTLTRAKEEQQPPARTGSTLIVAVGLGVAFLLFMAFLNVVKSGNILSETNLLFAALIFYAGAGALYLGFGVTGTDSYVKFASLGPGWAFLRIRARWRTAGMRRGSSVCQRLRNAAEFCMDLGGAHSDR